MQPARCSHSSCSRFSTPSATTVSWKSCASEITALTMVLPSPGSDCRKLRSIFSWLMGKDCR
ncbi:hypothetical protein ASD15_28885 [Massilia sp. Root351]|nr:hypothetical protein ASD15_28885 [Massilia sp. Root351]